MCVLFGAGGPVRLDAITLHSKGEGTSYKALEGEWAASALIRANSTWSTAGLDKLALSNDEVCLWLLTLMIPAVSRIFKSLSMFL